MEIDLNRLIGAPPGGFTWQFDPTFSHGLADGAGLSLTAAGFLTTPDCRLTTSGLPPPVWPYAIRVQALRDAVVVYSVTITADEKFISSTVVCYFAFCR